MKKEKIKFKIKKICKNCLIFIFTMIILFSGYSLAKYIDEVYVKYTMQYAEPILVIENDEIIQITTDNNYGIYQFQVRNYNKEEKITDVDLSYYIEILDNNKNIEYTMYLNNEQIKLENKKTEIMQLSKEKQEEQFYKIEIFCNLENLNLEKNSAQDVKIKVHAEQEG